MLVPTAFPTADTTPLAVAPFPKAVPTPVEEPIVVATVLVLPNASPKPVEEPTVVETVLVLPEATPKPVEEPTD